MYWYLCGVSWFCLEFDHVTIQAHHFSVYTCHQHLQWLFVPHSLITDSATSLGDLFSYLKVFVCVTMDWLFNDGIELPLSVLVWYHLYWLCSKYPHLSLSLLFADSIPSYIHLTVAMVWIGLCPLAKWHVFLNVLFDSSLNSYVGLWLVCIPSMAATESD